MFHCCRVLFSARGCHAQTHLQQAHHLFAVLRVSILWYAGARRNHSTFSNPQEDLEAPPHPARTIWTQQQSGPFRNSTDLMKSTTYCMQSRNIQNAFYDRGTSSTFPLKWFLNDGIPSPKVVGMPINLDSKMTFTYTEGRYTSCMGLFCFRGFLLSGKWWVITVEDHMRHTLVGEIVKILGTVGLLIIGIQIDACWIQKLVFGRGIELSKGGAQKREIRMYPYRGTRLKCVDYINRRYRSRHEILPPLAPAVLAW